MKLLPRAEQLAILRSVQRADSVDDPSQAMIAVEFAKRLRTVAKWLGWGFVFVGILTMALSAVWKDWIQLGVGVFLIAFGFYWFYRARRATRSSFLNEALLATRA